MDASNVPPPRGAPLTDSRRSAIRDDLDAFDVAVAVTCKSSLGTRENRRVFRKRPAAELRALVVVEGLFELRTRVHDERAVLRDWLVDWTALQQQDLGGATRTGNDGHDGGPADGILFAQSGDLRIPEHREVRIDHLGFRGQVEPDLKQLELVRLVRIEQR